MSTHPLHANNFRREALSLGNVMTSPGKVISAFKLENLSRESPLAQLGWTQYLPVDGLHSPDGNYTYVYQLFTDSYRVIHTVVKEDDLPCSKLMPGEVQYLNHLLINVGKDKPDMAELRFKASIFLGEELASIVNPFSFNAAIKNAIQRGYRLTPTQMTVTAAHHRVSRSSLSRRPSMAKRKSNIIESVCSCGEPISIETNCTQRVCRADKKRPFYPDESVAEKLAGTNVNLEDYPENGITVFRCRRCGACVDGTVPGAEFERAEAQEKAL